MSTLNLSRRAFLGGTAATSLLLASGLRAQAAGPITIGMIYVGPRDDYGWNQAHAVGAAALKALPDVTVVEEENVPETDAVAKSMESMIQLDGASLPLVPVTFEGAVGQHGNALSGTLLLDSVDDILVGLPSSCSLSCPGPGTCDVTCPGLLSCTFTCTPATASSSTATASPACAASVTIGPVTASGSPPARSSNA